MREGWRETKLGELFRTTNERLGPHTAEPPVFSVTKYDGIVLAEDYFGKRVASDKLNAYKVVNVDDWAYSTIHIDEGSIARNHQGACGVVSPMYTTMRFIGQHIAHPFYCEVLLRSPWMLNVYSSFQQGSINRRRSLPWKVFSEIEVPLPPLSEQRRIVDLIGAVDEAIERAEEGERSLLRLRSLYLESHFSQAGSPRVAVRDLIRTIEGGRSPKASDKPPTVDEFGVLKVSAVTSAGFLPHESKTIDDVGAFSNSHAVRRHDVLITRANTAALVGQTCLVRGEHPNLFLCDKTLRLVPDDTIPAAALVAALNSPSARDQLSASATGTSASMKNISQQNIGDVRVVWPENAVLVGETDQQFLSSLYAATDSVARLRTLRSNLLTALLSGEHEIPESYDELIGVAS